MKTQHSQQIKGKKRETNPCQLQTRHLPCTRVKSRAPADADVARPEGAQGKPAGQVFRESVTLRSWFYEPSACTFSYLEKHWIPSWQQLLLVTSHLPQAWLQALPFVKVIRTLASPLPLSSAFLSDLKCCLPGCGPRFVPNRSCRNSCVVTEDKMVGGHHRLNGHEFEQTPGVSDGQGDPRTAVHGVTESRARLSDWTTTEWDQNCFVNMNTLHLNSIYYFSISFSTYLLHLTEQAKSMVYFSQNCIISTIRNLKLKHG